MRWCCWRGLKGAVRIVCRWQQLTGPHHKGDANYGNHHEYPQSDDSASLYLASFLYNPAGLFGSGSLFSLHGWMLKNLVNLFVGPIKMAAAKNIRQHGHGARVVPPGHGSRGGFRWRWHHSRDQAVFQATTASEHVRISGTIVAFTADLKRSKGQAVRQVGFTFPLGFPPIVVSLVGALHRGGELFWVEALWMMGTGQFWNPVASASRGVVPFGQGKCFDVGHQDAFFKDPAVDVVGGH